MEKIGYIILLSIYFLLVPMLADSVLNIIGENNLKSNIYNHNSNSNIVRTLANEVSRVIGMDSFFEKLNNGL